MTHCRLILHHTDGRVEESSVYGNWPIVMAATSSSHADHWWKVVALRCGAEGGGVAELESTTLPAHLRKLEAT